MKILPDNTSCDSAGSAAIVLSLPQGLIGFKESHHAELVCVPDHLPFLWLKLKGGDEPIHFIVIEPAGLVPDYELEIFDEDAASLGITGPDDAMVLNIVTLRQTQAVEATVNLIGPILVNRRTGVARQLVIANYARYSAHHLLVEEAPAKARASA